VGGQSFRMHSQDGQELSAAGTAATLITQKSSESQSVYLTNMDMSIITLLEIC
jgi:hypothetical protein